MSQTSPTGTSSLSPDLVPGVARMVVADEDGQALIGRPDLARFIAVPAAGGEFVRVLQDTHDIGSATSAATAVAGEDVDGADFVAQLTAMGLLAPPVADGSPQLPRLTPTIAGWFFGRVAWTVYAVAALGSLLALALWPALRPGYADIWFTTDKALSTLVASVVAILLTGVHEVWHWLSGRALGIGARFRVSRRGIFLVFETDLTEVVTVPRRRRNGVYLAGMAIDAVLLAVALLVVALARRPDSALPELVRNVAAAVAFLKVLGIVQQWVLVFLRSDVYALMANLLGCHNLYRATWLTTKRRLHRSTEAERHELAAISDHDRSVASWFGWVYLAGVVGVAVVAVGWVVPYLVDMARWLGPVVARGEVDTSHFWTAVALLALTAFTWVSPWVIAVRERRMRQQGRLL